MKEIYYFGSFNPIHRGHVVIAAIAAEKFGCKVHITPSPCSPFKKKEDMLPINVRKFVIEEFIGGFENLDISDIDIEVGTNKVEHYTYETLQVIKERAKAKPREIGFLIGCDVLAEFEKWKNWKWIYDNFTIVVYPREGYDINNLLNKYDNVELATNYPDMLFNFSSTKIREMFNNFSENEWRLRTLYSNDSINILKRYLTPKFVFFKKMLYFCTKFNKLLTNE